MKVVFEPGGLARLREHVAGAERPLILSTPSRRHVDRATAALDGTPAIFDRAVVHVPVATVESALAAARAHGADALIAIGGGAAIGLVKAMRLEMPAPFIAVPTTYAGSEMTSIYGMSEGPKKRTGRDERVRPRVVLYDAELTASMPLGLTIRSLINGMAHIVSALSTRSLSDGDLTVAGTLWAVMGALEEGPRVLKARNEALRAASQAGEIVDRAVLGMQHKLAHHLGGRFRSDHGTLHSIVLPAFIDWLAPREPELIQSLERATGESNLATSIRSRLTKHQSPTTLSEIGITREQIEAFVAEVGEIPAPLVWLAWGTTEGPSGAA